MIEIHTTNGYRKYVNVMHIVEVAELSENKKASTVVILTTGEKIFVRDLYEDVRSQIDDRVGGISDNV